MPAPALIILLVSLLPSLISAYPRFGLRNRGFRPHNIQVLHHHHAAVAEPAVLVVQNSLDADLSVASSSLVSNPSPLPTPIPGEFSISVSVSVSVSTSTTTTTTSPATAAAFAFTPQPQYITLSPRHTSIPAASLLVGRSIDESLTFLREAEDDDWISFGVQYKEQLQWRRCKVLKFGVCPNSETSSED